MEPCRPWLVRHAKDVTMNRKIIYPFTLFAIVIALGMFAFASASPVSAGSAAQDTVVAPTIQVTVNPPAVTQIMPPAVNVTAVVPVTGTDQAGPNILTLLFYGFLGLLAIVLLVALFASANRTTYVRRDGPPPPPDDLP
jgi:ABC-type dipeptide/oligopeptide/nickel transport system permease subunit